MRAPLFLRSSCASGVVAAFVSLALAACSGNEGPDGGPTDGVGGDGFLGAGGISAGSAANSGGSFGSGGLDAAGGGAGIGGTSSGGASSGGASSGGTGGTTPDDSLAAEYPCDGDTSGYDVVVSGSGSNWNVTGGDEGAQSFTSASGGMAAALGHAYSRLAGSAGDKATLLVQGSGTIDASAQIKMPSHMVLNVCGTIDVTGTASGSDRSPLYARDRSDIDIPHARLTGNAQYGMFFRNVPRLHLGEIELEMNAASSGIGIRIDNNPSAGGARVTDIRIDHLSAESTGSHGVETYGVDGFELGRFDGVDTGECGVLLNDTVHAEIGVVHCENCAAGTGYAAFRVANSNGKVGSTFPAGNVHVEEVYAREGGRGIFSVSGSGGLTIDRIDIANTGNHAILLQNAYETTIATESGTVSGGAILLSNDTTNTNNGTFPASSDVTLSHLILSNGAAISEAWCQLGDRGNRASDISGGTVDMCFP